MNCVMSVIFSAIIQYPIGTGILEFILQYVQAKSSLNHPTVALFDDKQLYINKPWRLLKGTLLKKIFVIINRLSILTDMS